MSDPKTVERLWNVYHLAVSLAKAVKERDAFHELMGIECPDDDITIECKKLCDELERMKVEVR
jgi:hypothetical protein